MTQAQANINDRLDTTNQHHAHTEDANSGGGVLVFLLAAMGAGFLIAVPITLWWAADADFMTQAWIAVVGGGLLSWCGVLVAGLVEQVRALRRGKPALTAEPGYAA